MKTRRQIAQMTGRMEAITMLLLPVGFGISIFMGWGWIGLIAVVLIYVILNMGIYRYMSKAKCERCGHVDIFTHRSGLVTGCLDICPNCHHRLELDRPMKTINRS